MNTQGNLMVDGTQIVFIENEIKNSNETICEFNPETEYPTIFERNPKEAMEFAKIFCKSFKMYEAINEVLELFDGVGVPNINWIKDRLSEAIK